MKVQPELFESIKPKRKKPVALTGRSRKYLESCGYIVSLVERSVDVQRPGSTERFRNKFDCFGFADLVGAVLERRGTLYIQVTDHAHSAEHRSKIINAPAVPILLQTENRVQLHTWKASKRKGVKLWNLRIHTAFVENSCIQFAEMAQHWFMDNGREVEPEF